MLESFDAIILGLSSFLLRGKGGLPPKFSGPLAVNPGSCIRVVPTQYVVHQPVPVDGLLMRLEQADRLAQLKSEIVGMGGHQSDKAAFYGGPVG